MENTILHHTSLLVLFKTLFRNGLSESPPARPQRIENAPDPPTENRNSAADNSFFCHRLWPPQLHGRKIKRNLFPLNKPSTRRPRERRRSSHWAKIPPRRASKRDLAAEFSVLIEHIWQAQLGPITTVLVAHSWNTDWCGVSQGKRQECIIN